MDTTSTLFIFILLRSDSVAMLAPVSCHLSVLLDCIAVSEMSVLSYYLILLLLNFIVLF